MKAFYSTLALFLLISISNLSSQDFSKVQIRAEQLSDGIYVLFGAGGNIALSTGEDGALIVDSQYAPLSDKIKAEIKKYSDTAVKYVLNTHWHGDHTGGNANFNKDGAIIIAHENVKKRVSTDQLIKAFSREIKAKAKEAWPVITFTEDLQLHFNGNSIMALHVHNAHTDGDSFIYFPEDNIIHLGDCFFKDRFPFIDLSSGGSIQGLINAIQTAMVIVDSETKIIPGHGTMASKQDLLNYHNMLVTMKDRVSSEMKKGTSIDVMKSLGLDNGYEAWGTGFINAETFIDFIWNSLSKEENE